MASFNAYLEVWPDGTTLAQIIDLPGCFAQGASEGEALQRLRIAVPDYFRWLSIYDADTPTMSGEVDLIVKERVPVTRNALHEIRALFGPDVEPASVDDLDWGIALSSHAHQDITQQAARLNDADLMAPRGGRFASIGAMLNDAARMDMWIISRLDVEPVYDDSGEGETHPLLRLNAIHERVLLRLRDASPAEVSTVRVHLGERWSMRKVIRRLIQHERDYSERLAIVLGQS